MNSYTPELLPKLEQLNTQKIQIIQEIYGLNNNIKNLVNPELAVFK